MPLPITAISFATDYAGATAGVPLACNFDCQGIDASEIFLATLAVGGLVYVNVNLSDYTVNDMGGGVFTVTPDLTYASSIGVRVYRWIPYTQDFTFSEGGPLPAAQIMSAFNRVVQQIQQLRGEADLDGAAVTLPPGAMYVLPTTTFADAAARAAATPAFLGQVGIQLDTGAWYRGSSLAAGGWTVLPGSGTINVASGGTGLTALTAYAIMAGGTTGTGNMQQVSGVGTAGQVLTSNGAAALPTWQAAAVGSGDVVGPASSVDSVLPLFSGTTGKLLKALQGANAATAATLNLGSITDATARALTISQTWNNAGLAGQLFILDATSTASTAASTVQEWRVSGANRGKLYRDGALRLLDGSAAGPTHGFEAVAGSGMYRDAGGTVRISVAGVDAVYFSSTGEVQATGVFLSQGNGTAAAPAFNVNNSVGIYRVSAGVLGIAGAGIQRATFSATGVLIGAVNSATPVAQSITLGESSRPGSDSNVSGASGTLTPGNGTGNATGASLIFQTPQPVASGTGAQTQTTRFTLSATAATAAVPVITPGYTVAGLPAGVAGMRAHVTDSNAAITAGIGAVVAGGGANVVPVFYDGANWRIA